MNILNQKFKEVFFAVLPITVIVILLSFTLVPIEGSILWRFIIGSVFVILGLTLFLTGVDLGITPFGTLLGSVIAKKNKIMVVIIAVFILGFFISFAEPGLLVLANEIDVITLGGISNMSILVVVSLGIGTMMVIGFLRILYEWPLYILLNILYGVVLILGLSTSREFLAIAFDASGATTGVLAVPFMLSLSLGVTLRKKDSKSSEKDSFGLVSISSIGAIIFVMILNLISKNQEFSGELNSTIETSTSMIRFFMGIAPSSIKDSIIALIPLITIFLAMSFFSFTLGKREFKRMLFGFIYAFLGLSIFFIGINAGFMTVGTIIGRYLTTYDTNMYLIIVGFILGFVTILAEPAVYVLTRQIESVTAGYVKKIYVLAALSIGVGIAVALSMLRIVVPQIQLWHYIVPGYMIALALTFIVPKLFVGIAFDAGGVATGPMTATFILAFTNGAADSYYSANLLIDGFGMITMVALMPIITLQLLGLVFKIKTREDGRAK